MKKFFKDILTGIDNATFDSLKVSYYINLIIFHFHEFFEVYHSGTFNETEYWTSLGIGTAVYAGALVWKKDTEPTGEK